MMQGMARHGRNGDTMMAHVNPNEMIVPREVLQRSPQVARGLGKAFRDVGADPKRYVVGSGQNSINPVTGKREFFLESIMPFLTKAAANPMIQGAVSNLAVQALRGKKPSLRDALIGGAIGGGLGAISGTGTGMDSLDAFLGLAGDSGAKSSVGSLDAAVRSQMNKDGLDSTKIPRAEGLLGIGELLGTKQTKTGLGRILNTKAGEALIMGLGSQLLDTLFSEEEDPDPYGMMERFNRGAGEGPIRFRPVNRRQGSASDLLYANKGGPAYFPRRDGGIMPSEGSGTKDDVPAMLTAGEFVMTRDAVKGAGNGNLNRGIQKMYSMMDNLEGKA